MRNISLAAFTFAALLATTRPARACGAWSMHDNERHRSIGWGILYVDVFYDVSNGKRIAQAEADYYGGTVTITDEHGRTVGSSRADSSSYDIAISPTGKEQINEHHSWYWFNVTVRRGSETIVTSDNAVGLCSSSETGPNAREHQRREIEARVRAYLDWRKRL